MVSVVDIIIYLVVVVYHHSDLPQEEGLDDVSLIIIHILLAYCLMKSII
jgi:hypothetical protein